MLAPCKCTVQETAIGKKSLLATCASQHCNQVVAEEEPNHHQLEFVGCDLGEQAGGRATLYVGLQCQAPEQTMYQYHCSKNPFLVLASSARVCNQQAHCKCTAAALVKYMMTPLCLPCLNRLLAACQAHSEFSSASRDFLVSRPRGKGKNG